MLTSWTQLEVSAVALERNLEYLNLSPEHYALSSSAAHERATADSPWNNPAGPTLGIVGRTGSGKSTFVMALLRALRTEGDILTTDQSVSTVYKVEAPLERPSVLPSVRATEGNIIRVLPSTSPPQKSHGNLSRFLCISGYCTFSPQRKTEIRGAWKLKPAVIMEGTLDYELTPNGQALSQGQLQLLSMARALLRGSKLAIFDEATANIDPETVTIIQNVMGDFDQVIVLDAGQIVESGKPSTLLHFLTVTGSNREDRMSGLVWKAKKRTQGQHLNPTPPHLLVPKAPQKVVVARERALKAPKRRVRVPIVHSTRDEHECRLGINRLRDEREGFDLPDDAVNIAHRCCGHISVVELPGVVPVRPVARPVFAERDAGSVPRLQVPGIECAPGTCWGELLQIFL
ncbi:P-loop containing nucleoside triphosphate hydrolase protein [Mycena latifolia]|nr:P-loop containing nucleoside triphosphate hydrolase protein [Mycena latifolia]